MLVATLLLVGSISSTASAHDASNTSIYGITTSWDYFAPSGSNDDASNGLRIHLSSPRHTDSGSRGERTNPGRQENEDGRGFNWRAANGNYVNTTYTTTSRSRNLHARGYLVWVGPNPRDGNLAANRTHAQNWGAHITIITHSNAGSPSTPYNLIMWDSNTDRLTAQQLSTTLGPGVPGPERIGEDQDWAGFELYELDGNAIFGDAYLELQFHSVQSSQTWMYNQAHTAAWRVGSAVDIRLGHPS